MSKSKKRVKASVRTRLERKILVTYAYDDSLGLWVSTWSVAGAQNTEVLVGDTIEELYDATHVSINDFPNNKTYQLVEMVDASRTGVVEQEEAAAYITSRSL